MATESVKYTRSLEVMDTFKSCCTFVACPVIGTHARINFMFVLFQDEDDINYPLDSKLYTRLKRGYRASRALQVKLVKKEQKALQDSCTKGAPMQTKKIRSNP
jgi:hypothetical protein